MVNPNITKSSTSSSLLIPSNSAKILQDRLHELLTRLSNTIEHVRNWPDGDEASINLERSKLIILIRETISSLQRVENTIKNDIQLKQSLQNCHVPIDLLDLLDTEINPDCFNRGLLREAMAQLTGLRRRKNALEMLGDAVQNGINNNNQKIMKDINNDENNKTESLITNNDDNNKNINKKKRNRSDGDNNHNNTDEGKFSLVTKSEDDEEQKIEPHLKKSKST